MGTGGEKGRPGPLTPEPRAERLSTGGLDHEESLRRVPAMGEHSGVAERELTDEEVIDIWERTIAGVRDGTIPIFNEKDAFVSDAMRRLGY